MSSIVPGNDAPGGKRATAKGIACRYLYKKANTTLTEVHPKKLANHVLLDLAREASMALMEVRPKELANHVLLDLARKASIALVEVRPAC